MPVPLGAGRRLHAKVLIGVYDESVRLIVGSANLTEPGYRRNREIVAVLTASAKRPAEARLIASAIGEMGRLVEQWTTDSARRLQSLALRRLDEWAAEETAMEQWFAWGGGEQALWRQFLDRWPTTDQVERISIVSPFWSEESADGPVTSFVTALRQNGSLATNATLLLLTEAAPNTQASYKPKLPESYGDFDARSIGIEASALAVDPRVPRKKWAWARSSQVPAACTPRSYCLRGRVVRRSSSDPRTSLGTAGDSCQISFGQTSKRG